MTFVTAGLAIAGLCAIAVPILIHLLLRQRRKPIEWAAMRFLFEAFRRHRRRLRLEQWLLLAARCLMLAVLGFALARPLLEAGGLAPGAGARAVYIIIDNGLASGVQGADGRSALEQHIKQARTLIGSLGAGDAVGVITAARPARALLVPPSTDHTAVIGLLDSLTPGQSPSDLETALRLLDMALDSPDAQRESVAAYVLSEFRAGTTELAAALPPALDDSPQPPALLASLPAVDDITNVQVVAIDPIRSMIVHGATDGSDQVTVRLARTGGSLGAQSTRVTLRGLAGGAGSDAPPPRCKSGFSLANRRVAAGSIASRRRFRFGFHAVER